MRCKDCAAEQEQEVDDPKVRNIAAKMGIKKYWCREKAHEITNREGGCDTGTLKTEVIKN